MPNETGNQPPALHKKHVARLERERRQTQLILYSFIGILAAVVLLLGYGYLDQRYLQLKRPVAEVGGKPIPLEEFQARARLQRQQMLVQYNRLNSYYGYYQQLGQSFGMDVSQQLQQISNQMQSIQSDLDTPENIGRVVLDQMINEEIIRQEAEKRGITVSEEELNARIQADFGYFPNGTPTPTITPTLNPLLEFVTATPSKTPTPNPAFTATATVPPTATNTPAPTFTPAPSATPSPTATPYTQEGYEQLYKEAADNLAKLGFQYDVYRRFFSAQILQEKLQAIIAADAMPAEEQVHARHILVSDEALAKQLIQRLQNGEDFALLAREFSTDTGSAMQGGDLGWFGKGQMVPEFEAAAFALKNPGDFTLEPVKSQFGYHIIQLLERPYSPEQITAAKDQAFRDWLRKAREEYQVKEYDLWKNNIPAEPNMTTMATEAAAAQLTAVAKERQATPTPK